MTATVAGPTWRWSGPAIFATVAAAYAVGSLLAYGAFGALEIGLAYFPPAGVTAAALVLVDRRRWPWVLIAAFGAEVVVDMTQGYDVVAAAGFALGNTLEPLVGISLLRAWQPELDLRRRVDLARFTLTAVVAGPLVGGLVGSLALDDSFDGLARYLDNVVHWWAGDALGVLTVGAPIIALSSPDVRAELQPRWEAVAAVAGTGLGAFVLFAGVEHPLVFLAGPLLILVAFRLGVAGVAACSAVGASVANLATANDHGPFAALDDLTGQTQLGLTQLFLGVLVLTSWFFAVEIHERQLATAMGQLERSARVRLARVQELTASLATSASVEEVGQVVLNQAGAVLGADGMGLLVASESGLQAVVSSPPLPPSALYGALAVDTDLPAGVAARERRAIWYESAEDLVDLLPHLVEVLGQLGIGAGAALPLVLDGELLGVITVANREPRHYTADDRALAATVGEQVAQALHRGRLLERERLLRREETERRARAELMADLGAVLERSGGLEDRIQAVVERLVPAFADYATVEEVTDGEVRLLALAHGDPVNREVLRALRTEHRSATAPPGPVADARAMRAPVVVGPLEPDDLARHATDAVTLALLERLGPRHHVTVPLRTATDTNGVIMLGRSAGRPGFDADDVGLLDDLGWRLGQAIQQGRQYQRANEVALRLQHSLLPDRVLQTWELTTAARYDAGVAELEVGGDWYDTVPLPGGRVGLAVGDVVGRGLEAAATMGRLRTALTAIAASAPGPGELLERLDHFARGIAGADCASCCYVVVDPAAGELCYATAGHPPPLLRRADGTVTLLEGGRSSLLGVGRQHRPEERVPVDDGSVVLLYTDGLVERRDQSLDEGFARLADVLAAVDTTDLQALCQSVVGRMTGGEVQRDDIAVLAARFEGLPDALLHRRFPAVAEELAAMRADVGQVLTDLGVAPDDGQLALVAIGEACANATEHAYLGDEGEVELLVVAADGAVEVIVRDRGRWREPALVTPRGRGTLLMESLADGYERVSDDRGTAVRLRFARSGDALSA